MTTQINTLAIRALAIRAPETTERRWRLLRFGAELSRRGLRCRMFRPPNGRWRLRVRGEASGRVTVFCAGTEGIYVLVTAQGRILASADRSGARRAADLLTIFPALRARPAQESCTS